MRAPLGAAESPGQDKPENGNRSEADYGDQTDLLRHRTWGVKLQLGVSVKVAFGTHQAEEQAKEDHERLAPKARRASKGDEDHHGDQSYWEDKPRELNNRVLDDSLEGNP